MAEPVKLTKERLEHYIWRKLAELEIRFGPEVANETNLSGKRPHYVEAVGRYAALRELAINFGLLITDLAGFHNDPEEGPDGPSGEAG